ncbi:MAG TPA: SgcJ/EcaC family oxidoreductase [Planctomycetaceae bacterium]|nr:SgcJ/EcaC family oxidoreductase [Planctomycetaceae bacterium]
MLLRKLSVLFAFAVICPLSMCAAEPESAALQKTVAQSAEQFTKAFAERDAKALGQLFTPEAEYVDSDGTVFHGRKAIEAEYAASFAVDPPGTLSIDLVSIRPIAAGVVVEEGVTTFRPQEGGPSRQGRYTATHVKQVDGNWLLASVRELGSASVAAHDRLESLAWLIGRWREEVGGSVVNTEWTWSDDGNFLISEFSVRESRDRSWKGTHRVGWDAERKQFRSWVFDSSGGSAEGWWNRHDDDTWSINLSGVDAEGVRLSSRLSYASDGTDAIVVSQEQRMRGGVSLPGFVHRIVRQPPAPEAATTQR